MTCDTGLLAICRLSYPPAGGKMPEAVLEELWRQFYSERSIGYRRLYAAQGVNQQIDRLVRVWEDRNIQPEMFAVLENGEQYRIDMVQHLLNEDGLKVTDLTLKKVDTLYDVLSIPS